MDTRYASLMHVPLTNAVCLASPYLAQGSPRRAYLVVNLARAGRGCGFFCNTFFLLTFLLIYYIWKKKQQEHLSIYTAQKISI